MGAWENNIRRVVPYVAGEQPNKPDMVKLNTNECPYPPAPGVKVVIENMDSDRFRLYPDPTVSKLVEEIASFYGVEKDEVFVGVGSDDVIANAFITFFNSDKPILFPDITYSFYPVWADLYGVKYETPKVSADFKINVADYYKENGGIICENSVVKDGKIITAMAAGSSEEFSFELIKCLKDDATAEKVRQSICAR